jgi:hypothetical protein
MIKYSKTKQLEKLIENARIDTVVTYCFCHDRKYNIIQQKIQSWGDQIQTNSNKNCKSIKKLKITNEPFMKLTKIISLF